MIGQAMRFKFKQTANKNPVEFNNERKDLTRFINDFA